MSLSNNSHHNEISDLEANRQAEKDFELTSSDDDDYFDEEENSGLSKPTILLFGAASVAVVMAVGFCCCKSSGDVDGSSNSYSNAASSSYPAVTAMDYSSDDTEYNSSSLIMWSGITAGAVSLVATAVGVVLCHKQKTCCFSEEVLPQPPQVTGCELFSKEVELFEYTLLHNQGAMQAGADGETPYAAVRTVRADVLDEFFSAQYTAARTSLLRGIKSMNAIQNELTTYCRSATLQNDHLPSVLKADATALATAGDDGLLAADADVSKCVNAIEFEFRRGSLKFVAVMKFENDGELPEAQETAIKTEMHTAITDNMKAALGGDDTAAVWSLSALLIWRDAENDVLSALAVHLSEDSYADNGEVNEADKIKEMATDALGVSRRRLVELMDAGELTENEDLRAALEASVVAAAAAPVSTAASSHGASNAEAVRSSAGSVHGGSAHGAASSSRGSAQGAAARTNAELGEQDPVAPANGDVSMEGSTSVSASAQPSSTPLVANENSTVISTADDAVAAPRATAVASTSTTAVEAGVASASTAGHDNGAVSDEEGSVGSANGSVRSSTSSRSSGCSEEFQRLLDEHSVETLPFQTGYLSKTGKSFRVSRSNSARQVAFSSISADDRINEHSGLIAGNVWRGHLAHGHERKIMYRVIPGDEPKYQFKSYLEDA